MRADHLLKLIKQEKTFDTQSLAELAELIEEFPYFQTAYLLYTLNLKELNDSRYYSQLRKTACYMADRTQMFYRFEKDFSIFLRRVEEQRKEKNNDSLFSLIDSFLLKEGNIQEQIPDTEVFADFFQKDYISHSLASGEQTLQTNDREKEDCVSPLKYQDAIDRFLEENEKSPVKIELQDKDIQENENFLLLDTVEEDSFFSETLAKIYIKQKKYEKALEIIHKLHLIYPEKNRYFADQIRFLEKLIINTKK